MSLAAYRAAYYTAHREYALAYQAAYRKTHREEVAVSQADYREAHREERVAKQAAYRKAHHEEIIAKNAVYRASHREASTASQGAYRTAHRVEIAATNAAYYAAHREENASWHAADAKAYPEKGRARASLRHARKLGNSIGLPKPDYRAILAEFGMVCHICSEDILTKADLHFDHVIPLAKEGPHSAENIRPSHALCNLRKGSKIPESYQLAA